LQQDFYIHNGKDESLYYPRFTWHAGRYFEIIGTAEPLEFRVIHTEHQRIPRSSDSSDDLLNWYYEAYIRTQLNNIHCCVPSDCPHRERLGYTGDGQIASGACMTTLSALRRCLPKVDEVTLPTVRTDSAAMFSTRLPSTAVAAVPEAGAALS
jgi:alpha-L-rhamnosidase